MHTSTAVSSPLVGCRKQATQGRVRAEDLQEDCTALAAADSDDDGGARVVVRGVRREAECEDWRKRWGRGIGCDAGVGPGHRGRRCGIRWHKPRTGPKHPKALSAMRVSVRTIAGDVVASVGVVDPDSRSHHEIHTVALRAVLRQCPRELLEYYAFGFDAFVAHCANPGPHHQRSPGGRKTGDDA